MRCGRTLILGFLVLATFGACGGNGSVLGSTPSPDIEATVSAGIQATQEAISAISPTPELDTALTPSPTAAATLIPSPTVLPTPTQIPERSPTPTPKADLPKFSAGEAIALVKASLRGEIIETGFLFSVLKSCYDFINQDIANESGIAFSDRYLGDGIWLVELSFVSIYPPDAVTSPTSRAVYAARYRDESVKDFELTYYSLKYRVFERTQTVEPLQDFC